jgi:hypothetical protein
VFRRIENRLLIAPAARLLTGPLAFFVAGLVDVVTLAARSLRARAGRGQA